MKKIISVAMTLVLCMTMLFAFGACGTEKDGGGSSLSVEKADSQWASLEGKSLMIYCGAGMKQPFAEIADNFKAATGADVQVTYGNAAQIVSQITTTEQGDLFIAGAEGELAPLKENVSDSKKLVKHIPVIAVPKGNPAGIQSIADLGKVKLIAGDAEATPIGKVADAVLKDAGLLESANIVARTTTAPEMITALTTGECDAAVVWKENAAKSEDVEVLDLEGMDKYIKVIPAASLSCAANDEALAEFLKYLDSDEAAAVWTKYGYEKA